MILFCQHHPLPGGEVGANKILTLSQTKICDFSYPISDLTPKSIPYLRPDCTQKLLQFA